MLELKADFPFLILYDTNWSVKESNANLSTRLLRPSCSLRKELTHCSEFQLIRFLL